MKKLVFRALTMLLLAGCSSSAYYVHRVDPQTDNEISGKLYYTLPQTTLKIEVEQTHQIFIPGPYNSYALQFLGIKEVKTQKSEEYNINKISISASNQSDPATLFQVDWKKSFTGKADYEKFLSEGFLAPLNLNAARDVTYYPVNKEENVVPEFLDLSTSEFEFMKSDTIYKTVFRDSNYVKVPVIKKFLEAKNDEDKAREAAHIITQIRKRRAKLISWQYAANPSAEALKVGLEEMEKLEAEYLTLFVGRTVCFKEKRVTYYTPSATETNPQPELFRFSKEKGLNETEARGGYPLTILIKSKNEWQKSTRLSPEAGSVQKKIKNAFYTRIPERCEINIMYGNSAIYTTHSSISQFGIILPASSY
jgi:hypothetical protein